MDKPALPVALFNSPLECGLRILFLLDANKPYQADLQRLISYDYLLVYSADADVGKESLHPAVPFRGSEWLVKRDVIRTGLDLMFSRQLLDKKFDRKGILYAANENTTAFVDLLKSTYADSLRARAAWVSERFGKLSDDDLENYMTTNIGKWGAEFERLTAIRDLELG
jgi:hypothetical protein